MDDLFPMTRFTHRRGRRRGRAAALAVAALVGALALPAAGEARRASDKAPTLFDSPLLWATVNVCDTAAHPDGVGIRGSMPGSGVAAEEMFMRFQLQYRAPQDDKWHNIDASGDSGFVDVGSAKYRQRQAGRTFTVRPPKTGGFRLRGTVTFEWRKDGVVVRHARRATTSGHGDTPGADPGGTSTASCLVTGS